jgi:NAD(P)-dependent dehydrogenase (short-subunit alcohol dehydrogenase family)
MSIELNPDFYGKGIRKCIVLGKNSDLAQEIVKRLEPHWEVTGYSHDDPVKEERWDLLLVAAGTLNPVGRFVDLDFKTWAQGIVDNALNPLAFVREMLPHARYDALVVFFSGPNPKEPAPNYSSYDAGKNLLIRMTENLASEHTAIRFVCIGPGFHKTKIHGPHDVSGKTQVYEASDVAEMVKACIMAPRESLGKQIHISEPWRRMLNPFPLNEGF